MNSFGNTMYKGFSAASFACSVITLGVGLSKMFLYKNGDYGDYLNAYVGGDAYNYIINANYATGFFVLAGVFALMGIGLIALWYLSKLSDMQEYRMATTAEAPSDEQKIAQEMSSDAETVGELNEN